MKMRTTLLSIMATSILLFTASVQAGYSNFVPRWVTLFPAASTMGAGGYVSVLLDAAGSYSRIFYFCSVGATDTTNCDLNYLYTSDQLLALHHALQDAAANGQHVAWTNDMVAPRGKVLLFGYP